MNHVQLSDVQYFNLSALTAIKMGMQQDKVSTCCKFGLNAEQAEHLESLRMEQIWAIVANVGPTSLFSPRSDLLTLLQTPLPLAAPLASVRMPVTVDTL